MHVSLVKSPEGEEPWANATLSGDLLKSFDCTVKFTLAGFFRKSLPLLGCPPSGMANYRCINTYSSEIIHYHLDVKWLIPTVSPFKKPCNIHVSRLSVLRMKLIS